MMEEYNEMFEFPKVVLTPAQIEAILREWKEITLPPF
jgi:hypothetical protein